MRALLALTVCLSACVVTRTQPHGTVVFGPLVKQAIEATDVRALEAAGGERIASLSAEGSAFNIHDDLLAKTLVEAAALGGTHVVLVSQGAVDVELLVNGTRGTVRRPTGDYDVFRVPEARWSSLPVELQPNRVRADTCTHDDPRWSQASAVEKKEILAACRASRTAN